MRATTITAALLVAATTMFAACGSDKPAEEAAARQTQNFRASLNQGKVDPQNDAAQQPNTGNSTTDYLVAHRCDTLNDIVTDSFGLTDALVAHRLALGHGKKKAYLPDALTRAALNRDITAANACYLAIKNSCATVSSRCDAYMNDTWLEKIGDNPDPCAYTTKMLDAFKQSIHDLSAYENSLNSAQIQRNLDLFPTIEQATSLVLFSKEFTCDVDASYSCQPQHPSCASKN